MDENEISKIIIGSAIEVHKILGPGLFESAYEFSLEQESISNLHIAQLLTYLKLSKLKLGLIINFNVPVLKNGIKRMVNNL